MAGLGDPGVAGRRGHLDPLAPAQSVDATQSATFTAPAGWGFRVQQWVWEDGDHLVSPVIADGGDRGDRMARCSALAGRCVLITAD